MNNRSVNADNHQGILRYLRKQMSDAELAQFEVRLMNEAQLLRETQREEALISALHECQHGLTSTPTHSGTLGFREWFFQPLTAAAAVVVILVSIPIIGLQQRIVDGNPIENLQIASSYYVEGLRNAGQALNINADYPLLLNVDTGPAGGSALYSVRMRSVRTGEVIYQASDQHASNEGYLSLLLREPVSGEFEITVFQANAANAEGVEEEESTLHYLVSLQ